jgi:hypothetical protein
MNHINYKWNTEPVKDGFYMALKVDHKSKLKAVAVHVATYQGVTGYTGYTGNELHVGAGNPRIRNMSDEFVMWARLPDVF